ncbi:MAG: excinuclease ABC subunit UvrA, partial [Bacillota bacterium]|nr:excinuclease ABC subunit UvrA [Bacillota bacterium]
MKEHLIVKGAKEHNLKNIDVKIPRNQFVVLTGLSGSGKSSLAFDTIYAEGQRRYVESLSAYARQFLGQMEKPDVESIDGLSPAISIDQKTTSKNPRSTVGTVTEIYDYLRLLYARTGTPHCPTCHRVISPTTIDQIIDQIMRHPTGTRLQVLAPVIKGKKGTHQKLIESLIKEGYVRARINGDVTELSPSINLDKNKKHSIDVVIDRIVLKDEVTKRLTDSVETALRLAQGTVLIDLVDRGEEQLFNTNFSCPEHGQGIAEMEPRMFSFNAPYGACPACNGLGESKVVDPDLIIPDPTLSIAQGAIAPMSKSSEDSYTISIIGAILREAGYDLHTRICDLPERVRQEILYGTGDRRVQFHFDSRFTDKTEFNRPFEGLVPSFERRYRETSSDYMRAYYEAYMTVIECSTCHGKRLNPEVLAVEVGGKNIWELTTLSVSAILEFLDQVTYPDSRGQVAEQIIKEIVARLNFLKNVGLDYLTLARSASTLSGGESQRIRLATQIGSGLVGVMYILDEPSIGLHQKDN